MKKAFIVILTPLFLFAEDGDVHDSPITNTPITDSPITNTPIEDSPITNTHVEDSPITIDPQ